MIVELISVGTELLMGNIVNTNAQYLAEQCAGLGISMYTQVVIGDNPERLADTVRTALLRSDVIMLTGGLGPTEDDLTKATVAEAMGKKIVRDARSVERIKQYFEGGIYRAITENNWKQADVIEGSLVLDNNNGLAPGMIAEKDGKAAILLPGPPHEMIPMFEEFVKPYLKEKSGRVIRSVMMKCCGIGESQTETMILDIIDRQENPTVATYAKTGEVHVRVTAGSGSEKEAERLLDPVVAQIRERLGEYLFTCEEKKTLEEVIAEQLLKRGETIVTAESCTGGMIAARLVNVPGISGVFKEGFITYANEAKCKELGVREKTIRQFGVVSSEVVTEMAEGAARRAGADLALAVSGIAGPDGGTEEKPVGLVYIGCYYHGTTVARRYLFKGNRQKVREQTTQYALTAAWRMLNDSLDRSE